MNPLLVSAVFVMLAALIAAILTWAAKKMGIKSDPLKVFLFLFIVIGSVLLASGILTGKL